jgi:hypothetical protein
MPDFRIRAPLETVLNQFRDELTRVNASILALENIETVDRPSPSQHGPMKGGRGKAVLREHTDITKKKQPANPLVDGYPASRQSCACKREEATREPTGGWLCRDPPGDPLAAGCGILGQVYAQSYPASSMDASSSPARYPSKSVAKGGISARSDQGGFKP